MESENKSNCTCKLLCECKQEFCAVIIYKHREKNNISK